MNSIMVVNETHDYDKFHRLVGNRQVKEVRVKKIIKSIQTVGAIPNPIIVNEKMEVIDGQGRLEALRRLSLKVYYIVIPGLGLPECRNMNIDQTNWTLQDYIESYAEEGNENYERFYNLCKKYSKLGITVINFAASGLASCDNYAIKSGSLECTEEQYLNAFAILDYILDFIDIGSVLPGRRDVFYMAIGFCFTHNGINRERLSEKIRENYRQFSPAVTMDQMLDEISDAYNYRYRGEKAYLKTDYQKMMEKKYKWYRNKWGQKRNYLEMEGKTND